jgi:hypothetical protein
MTHSTQRVSAVPMDAAWPSANSMAAYLLSCLVARFFSRLRMIRPSTAWLYGLETRRETKMYHDNVGRERSSRLSQLESGANICPTFGARALLFAQFLPKLPP